MKFFTNEGAAWEALHGSEEPLLKESCEALFEKLFPEGHQESIRTFVRSCSHPRNQARIQKHDRCRFLRRIDIRALRLLVKYGQDYRPQIWTNPPKEEPSVGLCSANLWLFLFKHNRAVAEGKIKRKTRMVYVEGIAIGSLVPPMLHAWNAYGLRGTISIDWTHYAGCQWSRYLGIPFTDEEYRRACRLISPRKPRPTLLFREETFPRVNSYLQDLLAQRAARS